MMTVLGLMGGVAGAVQPDITELGNYLRSIVSPLQLTAYDVKIVEFEGFYYVAIDHNLSDDY